jgi:hypothetical protein
MADLTEAEIFDCLQTNFKLAVEHCIDLAKYARKGPTYTKLRDELRLIEGCCRQAAYWRQDARWLTMAEPIAEVHKRAGDWLRGIRVNGVLRKNPEGQLHPLFLMLAQNLLKYHAFAEKLRTERTGRVGMILPTPQRAPIRTEGRQVQVMLPERRSPGGLILPAA